MTATKTVAHGITFDNKHSWRDWKLVPTSRPVFLPPPVKTISVELPGSDGSLDLTESLTGDVKYENRTGSLEFQVENPQDWMLVYAEIMRHLHGQRMQAILDDDFSYYYLGRFHVNEWKSEAYRSKIVIDYDLEPYKYERTGSLDEWEWDSFDFETGIIRDYRKLTVSGSLTLEIPAGHKAVVPTITVQARDAMTVWFSGTEYTYNLKNGENTIPQILITQEHPVLKFTGYGTVSVDYRGGML